MKTCERDDKGNNLFNNKMTKFNYKEQHAVIVRCGSEEEQKEIFERLKSQGLTDLKIVSV